MYGAALSMREHLSYEHLDTETMVFVSAVTLQGVLNLAREVRENY